MSRPGGGLGLAELIDAEKAFLDEDLLERELLAVVPQGGFEPCLRDPAQLDDERRERLLLFEPRLDPLGAGDLLLREEPFLHEDPFDAARIEASGGRSLFGRRGLIDARDEQLGYHSRQEFPFMLLCRAGGCAKPDGSLRADRSERPPFGPAPLRD